MMRKRNIWPVVVILMALSVVLLGCGSEKPTEERNDSLMPLPVDTSLVSESRRSGSDVSGSRRDSMWVLVESMSRRVESMQVRNDEILEYVRARGGRR